MTPRANSNAVGGCTVGVPGYTGTIIAVVPGRVYVAERPGGGGRSHRAARREHDLAALHAAGVRTIVSLQRSRHALVEYAQEGFGTRWHPLRDVWQARQELPRAADDVADVLQREPGAVLIHVDRVSEWLAAAYAVMLVRLADSHSIATALTAADVAGLPVDDLARELVGIAPEPEGNPRARSSPEVSPYSALRAYGAAVAVIEAGGVTVSPAACRALLAACRDAVDTATPEVPSPR
jgi:hypothetical protein